MKVLALEAEWQPKLRDNDSLRLKKMGRKGAELVEIQEAGDSGDSSIDTQT